MLHEKAVMVSIWHCTRDSWVYQVYRILSQKGISGDCLVQTPQLNIEQVVQNHEQLGFEYLTGWRLHNLSQQQSFSLFQCSDSVCRKIFSLC